jgi:hypothetical protein
MPDPAPLRGQPLHLNHEIQTPPPRPATPLPALSLVAPWWRSQTPGARTALPCWRRWRPCCCFWPPSFRRSGTCAGRSGPRAGSRQARRGIRPAARAPAPAGAPGTADARRARCSNREIDLDEFMWPGRVHGQPVPRAAGRHLDRRAPPHPRQLRRAQPATASQLRIPGTVLRPGETESTYSLARDLQQPVYSQPRRRAESTSACCSCTFPWPTRARFRRRGCWANTPSTACCAMACRPKCWPSTPWRFWTARAGCWPGTQCRHAPGHQC